MKILYTVLFVLTVAFSAVAQDLQQEASAAYTSGDYAKAITLYEQILGQEGEAAFLYYNLGNAYYKTDEIAKAILNYERALLLSPNFADARFNLEIAQQRVVDKIEPVEDFFLKRWSLAIQQLLSSNGWANLAIFLFVLFIAGLVLYFFTRRVWTKKVGFSVAVFAFLLCVISNIYAANQKDCYTQHNRAVVFAPTVSIKSTPDINGTDLFLLHEGTTVNIKSRLGSWAEIELADGNVGWIEEKSIEVI